MGKTCEEYLPPLLRLQLRLAGLIVAAWVAVDGFRWLRRLVAGQAAHP